MTTDLVLARRYTRDSPYEAFDTLDVSEATRADYTARLMPFLSFVEDKQFSINTFLDFKRELRGRDDLSASSKNKYLVVARIFLKELNRRGILPVDITHNIRNFRLDKRHKVNGLDDREVESLEWWCQAHSVEKPREVAIMCLLFYQGLRLCELSRLNWEDVLWRSNQILIKGKGRDDKETVLLHPVSVKAIKQYYRVRQYLELETDRPRGAMFRSRSVPSKQGRITTRGLRHIVKTVFEEQGIEKTCHGLRHTFVTRLVKYFNGDITKVAQFSRHRSLEMVQVYNDAVLLESDYKGYIKAFGDINLFIPV
jgi:integrase